MKKTTNTITELKVSEDDIQADCVFWFKMQYRSYADLIHHSTNEGKRSFAQGKRAVALGMQKGYPDLFIAVARGGWHGYFIEMKTPKGKVRPEQRKMLEELENQGYKVDIIRGVLEFVKKVSAYMEG